MIGCIYKLTSPSGKIYIGQTKDLYRRFKEYTNIKCKSQAKLYYSLSKYGFESHDFHVIEFCNTSLLNEKERYWQDQFYVCGKMGLNLKLTTSINRSGSLSEGVRSRISASNIGKHNHTIEVRLLISKANKNRIIPEWHKKHNSKILKEKFKGEGNPFYGKFHSKELVKAISDRTTGGNNPKAKTFLNTENGVFYDTLNDLAKHIGVSNPTAVLWLNKPEYSRYKMV